MKKRGSEVSRKNPRETKKLAFDKKTKINISKDTLIKQADF